MTNYSKKKGLPPGSLVFTGKVRSKKVSIDLIEYSQDKYLHKKIDKLKDIEYNPDSKSIYWLNISGLHDTDIIEESGNMFGINMLVLEDILNTNQRPKTDFYDNYIFVTLKTLDYNNKSKKIDNHQISIILGKNYVITYLEKSDDLFDPLKSRIEVSNSKIRSFGSDYLSYAVIDIVVDNYFILLEKLGLEIESFEESLIDKFDKNTINQIYILKRENLVLRNSIWPLREAVSQLERVESTLISDKTEIFFRDLYDHTIQIIDNVEVYRDILSGLIDLYLSGISNKTNEVMKVLTIISTIFIPLTFIVGLYGMNFNYMPELSWRWGYITIWAIMVSITVFMIIFIRKRKWL